MCIVISVAKSRLRRRTKLKSPERERFKMLPRFTNLSRFGRDAGRLLTTEMIPAQRQLASFSHTSQGSVRDIPCRGLLKFGAIFGAAQTKMSSTK